jgi:hypothetical protein
VIGDQADPFVLQDRKVLAGKNVDTGQNGCVAAGNRQQYGEADGD